MSQLKELLAQIATLQEQASEARAREIGEAISTVKKLVAEYQLTPADVFATPKTKGVRGGKVAPKYRDNMTGSTWTGRGVAPKWIQGKNRADYLIAP